MTALKYKISSVTIHNDEYNYLNLGVSIIRGKWFAN